MYVCMYVYMHVFMCTCIDIMFVRLLRLLQVYVQYMCTEPYSEYIGQSVELTKQRLPGPWISSRYHGEDNIRVEKQLGRDRYGDQHAKKLPLIAAGPLQELIVREAQRVSSTLLPNFF